ncbi:MAG: efflux RND transporter permease subunit [Pseudomonadales bacterium]
MNKIVAWFVANPIAANILMVLIIVGGITTIPTVNKEFFPEHELDTVLVSVVYPGAGPAEIEQQICIRVEEVVDTIDGIDKIRCTAREGLGQVTIEVNSQYDSLRVLNETKSRVDAITTFPVESERPQVSEVLWRSRVISIGLAANIGEANLKELGYQLRDEISALPEVQLVELEQPRNYEVGIEISEKDLRRYALTFSDVANALRGYSINLPAGKLRTSDGDVQLQTRSQAYSGQEFADIVLLKQLDGTRVKLGDVATIKDGFEETDVVSHLNNMPSLQLDIYLTSNPDITATSNAVRAFVEHRQPTLPPGVTLVVWRDMNESFEGRLKTLFSSGLSGLALVFILLLLFLRPLLAFWVSVGIAVAFLGAIWMLPAAGVSFNIISLFAFILILGIVVDDAIIVGESVYTSQTSGLPAAAGAVAGASAVLKPVIFAVLTTMIVFGAFFFMPEDSPEPVHIGTVVLLALAFSILESLFILPSHLAHMGPERPNRIVWLRGLERLRARLAKGLALLITQYYVPFLDRCLHRSGLTLVVFAVAFLVPATYFLGGWMQSSFFPRVTTDSIYTQVRMPEGSPFSQLKEVVNHIEAQAQRLKTELNAGPVPFAGIIQVRADGDTARAALELINPEQRSSTNEELKQRWLKYIGDIPAAEELEVIASFGSRGKPIELELSAPVVETLLQASAELKQELARYPGVINIRDSLENARPEIVLKLKPLGESLNLSLADVARQVRRGFYGEEVQRIPRLREDVKVMVRYPRAERESIHSVLQMRIRTPDGMEVPFETIAEVSYSPSYRKIERVDRKRQALVTADLQPGGEASAIVSELLQKNVPDLQARYPGLQVKLEGEQQEEAEFKSTMLSLLFATAIIIYGLMAVVFHSYWQPLLIVTAIPFGIVGAILGHVLIGREVSMFSLMGIIACAGVVVNDNLVLIDRVNRLRDDGMTLWSALLQGSADRFRAIVLTSLTTFVGLLPILTQTSIQAQFLIPMVISLAFGVLLATFVTLLFTPVFYLRCESGVNRLKNGAAGFKGRLLRFASD